MDDREGLIRLLTEAEEAGIIEGWDECPGVNTWDIEWPAAETVTSGPWSQVSIPGNT